MKKNNLLNCLNLVTGGLHTGKTKEVARQAASLICSKDANKYSSIIVLCSYEKEKDALLSELEDSLTCLNTNSSSIENLFTVDLGIEFKAFTGDIVENMKTLGDHTDTLVLIENISEPCFRALISTYYDSNNVNDFIISMETIKNKN